MSRNPDRPPRLRAAAFEREPFRRVLGRGPLRVDVAMARGSGGAVADVAPVGMRASRVGVVPASSWPSVEVGGMDEFPVQYRLASLGRLLDSDWHFDEALDVERRAVLVGLRLGPTLWRVRELLPLTPFGLGAPTLGLGDVVEVGFVRPRPPSLQGMVERGRRWEYRLADLPEDALLRPGVSGILHELHEAGGAWALVGDTLAVHVPRLPQETMPSPAASQRIAALRRAFAS